MSKQEKKMDEEIPDYIQLHDKGAEVILLHPLIIAGVEVPVLSMREIIANDLLEIEVMQQANLGDMAISIKVLSSLCAIAPEEIGRLNLRDFAHAQEAYGLLFKGVGGPKETGVDKKFRLQ